MVGKIAGAVAIELDPDDVDGDGLKFVEGPHEDLYGHGTACAGHRPRHRARGRAVQRASARSRAHGSRERVRGGSAMGDRDTTWTS